MVFVRSWDERERTDAVAQANTNNKFKIADSNGNAKEEKATEMVG